MFDHFLITRFNLRNSQWQATKNHEPLLDEAWMRERLRLFAGFCLPSIAAQSNRNFRWLIFLDTTTGETYRQELAALTRELPFVQLHYIDGMPAFKAAVHEQIAQQSQARWLITSRIDNDDCLHRDFIDKIQQRFDRQDFQAIDAMDGYTLQIAPQVRLGKKEHIFNPFISLIEKREDCRTVWAYDHAHWKHVDDVLAVRGKRLWMSIIHQQNKVNEFDGYGDVDWASIRDGFHLSPEMDAWVLREQVPVSRWRLRSLRNWWHVKSKIAEKRLKRSIGLYRLKR